MERWYRHFKRYADISRGSVWQAVRTIEQNWNVYIIPRVVISSAGAITGKYLDIMPAGGTWRGLRLAVRKNFLDPIVTYNDEEVLTALYGYGGSVNVAHSGGDDTTAELTFADEAWTATSSHPAKPSGQTYLEWPDKTALYGRNGRPRFGYYQNANIKDATVLLEKTWEALQRTADPKISISGTCADLKRLGYADEPLRLHDLAVVEIEETGEQFYKEVIRLDVDLIDPSGNTVDIGDYIPNIIYINRDTAEKARGGGGGGARGQTPEEADEVETFTQFERTDNMIGMVVGMRNGGYYVKAGEIVLAINADGGTTAKIQADTIDIDGLITALSAKQISVGGLTVNGYSNFYNNANFHASFSIAADGGNFTVFGKNATWQSKTVVTDISVSRTQRKWVYLDASNNQQTSNVYMVHNVTKTTATMNYLGGADS